MKKIAYVDMDGVLFDYYGAHTAARLKEPEILYPQSQYGFFRDLRPIRGGIEAVKKLSQWFEVYILSAPSHLNPLSYTEKADSIKIHLGEDWVERLILTRYKNLNKGHYLIDDTFLRGVIEFEGEHIHFGSEKFPTWAEVVSYLETKK